MHTVDEGRGENDLLVSYYTDPTHRQSAPTNLHAVWDGGLIRSVVWGWGGYVGTLEAGYLSSQDLDTLAAGTPIDWAEEAHKAARIAVQGVTMHAQLDEDYLTQTKPVMERQLALAGLRLARILNDVLQ